MQATSEDDTLAQQNWENLWNSNTLWQVDGGHAVGLVRRVGSDLLQTERCNSILNLLGRGLMSGKSLVQWTGEDLGEGGVESVDELWGWGGEVRWLQCLVRLHDWEPIPHGSEVGSWWVLAGLESLNGAAREHGDGETSWNSDTLLGGGDNSIKLPVIEENLLRADGADTINNEECLWRDALDQLTESLELREDTSGCVDVGDGNDLVLLLLERLLNLWQLWAGANWCLELGDICAVDAEAVCKGVTKVTSVKDEGVVSWLAEVGGDKIPAEGSRAGDNEWLRVFCGGLEEFAEHGEGLAEGLDECWRSVRLAMKTLARETCRALSLPSGTAPAW